VDAPADAVELAEAVEGAQAVAVAVLIPTGAAVAVLTTIRNMKRGAPKSFGEFWRTTDVSGRLSLQSTADIKN
jgi:hypothetical protein